MPITIVCPNLLCKKALQVRDDTRGHRVRCPHCQQILIVPFPQQSRPEPKQKADSPT